MRKLTIIMSALFLLVGFGVNAQETEYVIDPSDLPKEDAYKAIVKINTYIMNDDYKVTAYSSGSGVIVDPTGLVLTNHHVVYAEDNFDSSERVSAQIICMTTVISQVPDCSYIGRVIAKNKDMDIALLKIDSIPGYSAMHLFDYLDINDSGIIDVNDEVVALGYPGIGGDTITITKGIVSGKMDKYGQKWIKTDTVTSFGSSGGAVIDSDGKVIGITTQAHSDMLGTLGYLIDMSSVSAWFNANNTRSATASKAESRVVNFVKTKLDLRSTNEYRNTYPSFSVTKPSEWDFSLSDENAIGIDMGSDEDGGAVVLVYGRYPYAIGSDSAAPAVKRSFAQMGFLSMISIVKDEEVTINGNKARAITVSAMGEMQKLYYIPSGQYLIEVNFNYGKDDKDKVKVDAIINSIKLYPSEEVVLDPRSYVNNDPVFSLRAGDNWAFLQRDAKEHPLFISYKPVREAFFDVELENTDENTYDLENAEYMEILKQTLKEANSMTGMMDYKMEIRESNAHYNISSEISDIIMIDYVGKSVSEDKIISQNRVYHIKVGDKYLIPNFNYFSDDEAVYADLVTKFDELLTTLSLSGTPNDMVKTQTQTQTQTKTQTNEASGIGIKNRKMYERLRGKIMIKVEDAGKAYYINPASDTMHYLGRPEDAFAVMREQGVGISTADLEKIPVGLSNLGGPDADRDGLPDLFEDAIGTDKNKVDTDGDGFNDRQELEGGYSPRAKGQRMNYNANFSTQQKGKIFLQVEGSGEAWYINPTDGMRYFLGRPTDAFNVMRNLGLGISNADFSSM